MIRIGFTGTPGSGKTSTARALVSHMRELKEYSKVELVQEYARRYINKHGHIEFLWEQYRITNKQIEWEESIRTKDLDYLITDSPIFMGLLYANELPRTTQKDVMLFNDIIKIMTKLDHPTPRYNFIFHIPPKLEPINDGVRASHQFNKTWRNDMDMQIRSLFKIFRPTFFNVLESININDRIEECIVKIKSTMEC